MIDIGHETWQIFFLFPSYLNAAYCVCVYKHLVKYSFDIQIKKKKTLFAQVNVARYGTHMIKKILYSNQDYGVIYFIIAVIMLYLKMWSCLLRLMSTQYNNFIFLETPLHFLIFCKQNFCQCFLLRTIPAIFFFNIQSNICY